MKARKKGASAVAQELSRDKEASRHNAGTKGSTTAFQDKVYAACRRIPKGSVTTYGNLARAIGCGSSQAVGQALKRNPFAPEVPCHRVIASDWTLGGFQGAREGAEICRKKRLLKAEGVDFVDGKLVEPGRVCRLLRGK